MLIIALSIVLFVGCQRNTGGLQIADPVNEMVVLFEWYSHLYEDRQTGEEILQRFKEDPASFLEALVISEPGYREQILVLTGHVIADARSNDPIVYAEYANALELAANLDLGEDSLRMLGFVHANIEYWYNH